MNAARIQQILILAALGAALGAVLIQAVFKPSPEAHAVAALTSHRRDTTLWPGRYAPDFTLPLRDGASFRLADHIGRQVIILNFFTTWCGPCRAEMPELSAYALKHRGATLVLVGINVDEKPDAVDAFCAELKPAFPVGIDTNRLIAGAYGVRSYPTTVLIGTDGRVALYQIGGIANADVAFAPFVAEHLERIRQGRGTDRPAYEAGISNQPPLPDADGARARRAKASAPRLDGPARACAERLKCPSCGDSVSRCGCGLCDAVKTRLAAMNVTNKTDAQVLCELFLEAPPP